MSYGNKVLASGGWTYGVGAQDEVLELSCNEDDCSEQEWRLLFRMPTGRRDHVSLLVSKELANSFCQFRANPNTAAGTGTNHVCN